MLASAERQSVFPVRSDFAFSGAKASKFTLIERERADALMWYPPRAINFDVATCARFDFIVKRIVARLPKYLGANFKKPRHLNFGQEASGFNVSIEDYFGGQRVLWKNSFTEE